MIGLVDKKTISLAVAKNIVISGGSINKLDKRIRIFVKGRYPGADTKGYALRSRVVWWLNTGEVLRGCKYNIHHKNGMRQDDRFTNLEKLLHSEHSKQHHQKHAEVPLICKQCRVKFTLPRARLREKGRGSYCSQTCYHKAPKKDRRVELRCQQCRQPFKVIPFRARFMKFCSPRCAAFHRWHK